jgi:hypothetical protein
METDIWVEFFRFFVGPDEEGTFETQLDPRLCGNDTRIN